MKLIIIYGPSAAGKHTIGEKVCELTGYKFFYNHLTVDVVRALFEEKDRRRLNLLSVLRLKVIEEAARQDFNTVFTVAYTSDKQSAGFMKKIIKAVTSRGGTVHFVRLNPPDATLFERLGNASRQRLNKPTDPADLRRRLDDKQRDLRCIIDYPSQITLDTSKLTPLQSARRIIKEFDL
jgi:chloramphenicol 3-O-phosphotransferase